MQQRGIFDKSIEQHSHSILGQGPHVSKPNTSSAHLHLPGRDLPQASNRQIGGNPFTQ